MSEEKTYYIEDRFDAYKRASASKGNVAIAGTPYANLDFLPYSDINYIIDEEFAKTVRSLNKNGTAVMIRTFDPNLNNEIIKKQTVFKKSELCVIKLNDNSQISKEIDKADSGIVSKGRSRSLLKAIPVCKNITKIRKAALIVKVIASITGLTLLGLTVFGVISSVPTLFVGLFYVPWMLIIFAISAIYLARIN